MAYDEKLAERIRQAVGPRPDVTEKKMFGGVAFLLDGKMFVGIVKGDLIGTETARMEIATSIDPRAHPRVMTPEGRTPDRVAAIGAPVQLTVVLF